MDRIREPRLGNYRNSELLQYIKDVIELVNAYDVVTLQLTTQRDALVTIMQQLEAVFQQEQWNGITQEIIALDVKRGNALKGIKHLLEGFTYHSDNALKNAAKLLLHNFNNYGKNIPRMNYQMETAVIDSMLVDWETETNLNAAANMLPLAAWITELKMTNTAFNDRYLARVTEVAANPSVSFYSLRAECTTKYRALVSHLKAYATLRTNDTYQQIINEIYVLAKEYNLVLKHREG